MSETQMKQSRRRRVFGCYADARGTVTIFVAVWLLVIAGLASVGIDGGYWYLMRRQAQDAADMAAVAGVQAMLADQAYNIYNASLSTPGPYISQSTMYSDAVNAGATVATANGFTDDVNNADVYITAPPTSGPFAYQPNTVEAVVQTKAPFILSALVRAISSMTTQTIGTRAVASLLTRPGNACLLSLYNPLTFQGSNLTSGNKCIFASNATGPDSITAANSGGNMSVSVYSLLATGGCNNCTPQYGITTIQPVAQYQPPTPDPFAILNSLDFTPLEVNPLPDKPNDPNNPYGYLAGYYKNGLSISGGTNSVTYTLDPGLYILGGKGLSISSGYSVTCSACTFVILDGGSININGALVTLTADASISDYSTSPPYRYSLLDGMLFYQQTPSKLTGNSQNDYINGNTGSYYSGGIYLPGGNLTYNGDEGTTTSGYPNPINICTEIVASQITMTGNGTTNVDNQGCVGTAAQAPPPQTVALVE